MDHSNSITSYNVATAATRILIVAISYYGHHKDTHICNITGDLHSVLRKKNRLTSVVLTLTLSLTALRIPAELIIILPLNSA